MITAQDIYKEIKSPEEVAKMQEPPMLGLIYKAIYMCLRLLIDVRANQVKMSKGISIVPVETKVKKTVGNPVIKPTDNIQVDNTASDKPTKVV